MKHKKILIIGGNAAGPAAAAMAKRTDPSAEVLMFESGPYISTGTCEIPYVLSDDIKSIEEIILFSPEKFLKEKKARVFVDHLVEDIDRKNKAISVRNKNDNKLLKFEYDKLILATGSTCKNLPNFNPRLKNILHLKTITDLIKIKNYINKNSIKSILIVGGGYIGLEAADAMNSKGYDVNIIDKQPLPLPYTEKEIQKIILEVLDKNGIRFFGNVSEPEIFEENDRINKIKIDGRLIDVDLVLMSVGFKPNNSLAERAGLEIGEFGALRVNKKMQTSDINIFAAGDNCEIISAVTNRPDYFPLAAFAYEQGHTAGENAAGGNAIMEPAVKNISVKILNKFHVDVGISSAEAKRKKIFFDEVSGEQYNRVKAMPESEKVFGKIIYEKSTKRILGASFIGGREVEGYGNLVSALIKTKQAADILGRINYNYTPPLSPMLNLLLKLGRKIK